jgi:hypothetical protein
MISGKRPESERMKCFRPQTRPMASPPPPNDLAHLPGPLVSR